MIWQKTENKLVKTFDFPDFKSALEFVNKVGELAEQANHHPDIQLSWGKVIVELTTHSAGGVTDKDIKLSEQIDTL